MSRIAKNPIKITKDVECSFNEGIFSAKGKLGKIEIAVKSNLNINIKETRQIIGICRSNSNSGFEFSQLYLFLFEI